MSDVWSDETWRKLDSFTCPGCGQIVFTDTAREMCEECRLRQQLATARAALAWYALPDTYLITHPDKGSLIMHDGGHRARLALEKMDAKPEK